jgi:hypothetical protein
MDKIVYVICDTGISEQEKNLELGRKTMSNPFKKHLCLCK